MKKLTITLIVLVSMSIWAGTSFSFRTGTTAFDFLRLPVGGAHMATGGTSLASIDTALAGLINPSRLDELGNFDIRAGSIDWILDTGYQYAAIAKRISDDLGVLSVVVRSFDYGEFEYTKPWGYVVDPSEDGETFSGNALAATLGWGKQLTKNFAFGASASYVYETLEEYMIDSMFFNIGFTYENEEYLKGLRIAFSAENFGSNVQYFEDSDALTLPLVMKYGLLWDVFQAGKNKFVLEFNAAQYKDQDMYGSLSLTYIFNSMVYFYTGYTTNTVFSPFSAGLGLKVRVGRTFWDIVAAYNTTEHFGGKVTIEAGAMIF